MSVKAVGRHSVNCECAVYWYGQDPDNSLRCHASRVKDTGSANLPINKQCGSAGQQQ